MKRIILAAMLVAAFTSQASAYVGVSIGGPYPGIAVSVGPPPPPPPAYVYYPGPYYVPAPAPPVYVYKPWHHSHYYRQW